eukprot:365338-Chlamydomonas_euryale.AAC.12
MSSGGFLVCAKPRSTSAENGVAWCGGMALLRCCSYAFRDSNDSLKWVWERRSVRQRRLEITLLRLTMKLHTRERCNAARAQEEAYANTTCIQFPSSFQTVSTTPQLPNTSIQFHTTSHGLAHDTLRARVT